MKTRVKVNASRAVRLVSLFGLINIPCVIAVSLFAENYDPLRISGEPVPISLEFVVPERQRRRNVPIRIYLPKRKTPAAIVLFSHGLGGSRQGSPYLGMHWAARGYVAVFLQHPGSDDSVWMDVPRDERLRALQKAASLENFLLRVKDVPVVLDQLDRWNSAHGHVLEGRMDMTHVGMSGLSFGALTAHAVSGQTMANGIVSFTDQRIMAAIGDVDINSRLAVFPALPGGGKYEVVLYGAEHSAFTNRPLPGDTETRNPNHHQVILALSTAFWDAWLQGDRSARAWYDGTGPYSVLEKNDRWQRK